MKSFSKQDQLAKGNDPYIFRVNLGTFGEFDTPASLFDEDYLITVPMTENRTAYLAGMFYSLDEAIAYQKSVKKEGYINSFVVAFKDGKELGTIKGMEFKKALFGIWLGKKPADDDLKENMLGL